jgi:hypothetical protein
VLNPKTNSSKYSCLLADVSGNRVLESADGHHRSAAAEAPSHFPTSTFSQEARSLIGQIHASVLCNQLEQLGIALGVFITLKDRSAGRQGQLKMQSVLQVRATEYPTVQAARDSFWKGLLVAVSGRHCSVGSVDITANSLDRADEDAVLAVLNKLVVDGVARFSVGHAFLKHPSIAVKLVDTLTCSCQTHYLHSLNLTATLIGNDGAVMLSRALGLRASGWPHQLNLSKCGIGDAGCIALVDALLQYVSRNELLIGGINLSQNTITDEAMIAISPKMMRLVEMHVAVWAEAVRNVWMMRQNRPSQVLPAPDKSYTLRCCHCWIEEFDLECNVISDLGLRHLISSFLCKSILKCRATAIALLVQDDLPFTGFEECFQEVDVKPPIHMIKFGGNLRPAPSGATTVHICQADPLTAHDCCAAASKNSEAKSAQACSLQLAHLLFCVFNFISG